MIWSVQSRNTKPQKVRTKCAKCAKQWHSRMSHYDRTWALLMQLVASALGSIAKTPTRHQLMRLESLARNWLTQLHRLRVSKIISRRSRLTSRVCDKESRRRKLSCQSGYFRHRAHRHRHRLIHLLRQMERKSLIKRSQRSLTKRTQSCWHLRKKQKLSTLRFTSLKQMQSMGLRVFGRWLKFTTKQGLTWFVETWLLKWTT